MTSTEARGWIHFIKNIIYDIPEEEEKIKSTEFGEALDMAIKALEVEYLTDKEQRIFLKAMSREREICKQVDDEYDDENTTVSLVKVCNEIERKVKKIWE